MGTIGEFNVEFELYNIADVMKQLDSYEKEMKEAAITTEKTEKRVSDSTSSWASGFKKLQLAAVAALGGIYYNVMKTSPAIIAHMGSIRIAMDLVSMTIGEAISPLFQLFEDMAWGFSEWFTSLDEGTQKAIGYASALTAIVTAAALLGGPWVAAAVGAVTALAIAYAEDFGNMQSNVDELWENIKDKDWLAAWTTLKKTVDDLWFAIKPYMVNLWNNIVKFFKETDWKKVWENYVEAVKWTWNSLSKALLWTWNKMVEFYSNINWSKIWEFFWDSLAKTGYLIGLAVGKVTKLIIDLFRETDWSGLGKSMWNGIASWFKAFPGGVWGVLKSMIKGSIEGGSQIPGNQEGGYISHTGLHLMHAGEQVIPSGIAQNNGGGGLTGGISVTNNNVFYGNMGDRHTMTQNVNDMTQTMKTSLKQYQSTSLGGRF